MIPANIPQIKPIPKYIKSSIVNDKKTLNKFFETFVLLKSFLIFS